MTFSIKSITNDNAKLAYIVLAPKSLPINTNDIANSIKLPKNRNMEPHYL